MSMLPVAWPATPMAIPPSSGEAARSAVTSCSVETLDGPLRRDHLERGDGAVGRGPDRGDGDDAVEAGEALGDGDLVVEELRLGGPRRQIGDDQERSVGPFAELLADQVVRLVLGRVRVVRGAEREAQAQRGGRDGDDGEDGDPRRPRERSPAGRESGAPRQPARDRPGR